MKVVIVWILGPLIAFVMAAMAGTTYRERSEPNELQQAQHSRDWAARHVCKGKPFIWEDDKTLVCFREIAP